MNERTFVRTMLLLIAIIISIVGFFIAVVMNVYH